MNNNVEIKFLFELESDFGFYETEEYWTGTHEETYQGEAWQECCDQAIDNNLDYDVSIFPTDEDGNVGTTRKDIDKIYEKNHEGDWKELTGNFFDKVFDYYCDLFEKKMSLGE